MRSSVLRCCRYRFSSTARASQETLGTLHPPDSGSGVPLGDRLSNGILGLFAARPGRRADEFPDGFAKPRRETRVDLLGFAE